VRWKRTPYIAKGDERMKHTTGNQIGCERLPEGRAGV
jgi:hypothetical protein